MKRRNNKTFFAAIILLGIIAELLGLPMSATPVLKRKVSIASIDVLQMQWATPVTLMKGETTSDQITVCE